MYDFNFALCDDDEFAIVVVANALKDVFSKKRINISLETFTSPSRMMEALQEKSFDALFLDIDMPELDGIELAKFQKSVNPNVEIVFVSNCEDRVFESFSVHPYGFIRKKNFLKDIAALANNYLEDHKICRQLIHIESHNNIVKVDAFDIVYVECNRDCQSIFLKTALKPLIVRSSMATLEQQLAPFGFIRVHKGYLVNYRHISRIDSMDITLNNNSVVPVSRRKLKEVRAEYMKLSRNSGTILIG